jgi:hypothetical protein
MVTMNLLRQRKLQDCSVQDLINMQILNHLEKIYREVNLLNNNIDKLIQT